MGCVTVIEEKRVSFDFYENVRDSGYLLSKYSLLWQGVDF
jgi:hypothetical protein